MDIFVGTIGFFGMILVVLLDIAIAKYQYQSELTGF